MEHQEPHAAAKPQIKKAPRIGHVYLFPIDDGFTAQLILPRDLTHRETLRLRDFLMTLEAPWCSDAGGDDPEVQIS